MSSNSVHDGKPVWGGSRGSGREGVDRWERERQVSEGCVLVLHTAENEWTHTHAHMNTHSQSI